MLYLRKNRSFSQFYVLFGKNTDKRCTFMFHVEENIDLWRNIMFNLVKETAHWLSFLSYPGMKHRPMDHFRALFWKKHRSLAQFYVLSWKRHR